MVKTAESRLQALEDREAIRELQAIYCFLVDDGRFDELVENCFTEDARCDFRLLADGVDPFLFEGHQEIRVFFKDIVAGLLRGFFGQVILGTAGICSTSTSQPRNARKPATTFQAVFPVTLRRRSHLRYSRLASGPSMCTLRLRQKSK